MTKYEFLGDLSRLLSDIPEEERKQALKYYEDYFADAGEDAEEQVLRELGSPEEIARQIKEDSPEAIEYGDSVSSRTKEALQPHVPENAEDTQQNADFTRGTAHTDDNTSSQTQWQQQDTFRDWQPQEKHTSATSSDREKDTTKIVLIILLAILLSPVWGTGLIGILAAILGIISAILGIFAAMILGGGGVAIAGICCFFGGLIAAVTGEAAAGVLTLGIGCILFSVGCILCYLGIMICIKLAPAVWKEMVKFFNWCVAKINRLTTV